MPRVTISPAALQDLSDTGDFIANDNIVAATHLDRATFSTFERLAHMPELGKTQSFTAPRLARLRFFPVTRFRHYLIFYQPTPEGIEVVRVLHGARDITKIFGKKKL